MIYPINHLPGDIPVGVQTEQGVEVIGFDVKPWLDALPDMAFSVWHTRPGEKEAYPAKDQMMVGTVLYWHPDSYDTAIAGDGKVEIAGVGDNQRKLSGFVKTSIRATSLGATKEPGENIPPWYEAVLQAAQDVKADVNVGTGGLYLVRAASKEGSYIFRTDRAIEEVREAVAAGKTCILVHDEGRVYTYCGEMPLSSNPGINVPTFAAPPKYKQWDGFEYRQVQMKPDGTALLSGYSVAKTPNPYKLTIGGVDYDGSKAVNVLPAPADTASPAYLRWNGAGYVPATVDSVKAELGGGGGTVEVDATLTKANTAADAKVVGDRFTSLSEEIAALKGGNDPTMSPNLCNPDTMSEGFIYPSGNYSSSTNYQCTDYIAVTPGDTLHFSTSGDGYKDGARYVCAYGADMAAQPEKGASHDSSLLSYTVPDGVAYVRLSFYAGVTNIMVNTGDFPLPYVPYGPIGGEEDADNASDILSGKKWVVFGDSFTAGGYGDSSGFDVAVYKFAEGRYAGENITYPFIISERTGLGIERFFAGGRTLANPADGTFTNSITNPSGGCYYQTIPEDADYITIYLGINDSHHEAGSTGDDGEDTTGVIPLGTADDTDASTFCGAWNVVLPWLMTNRPNAHIGIIVSNGVDRVEYRTATIAAAKKWGIPYLDLNGDERCPAMIRTVNPDISSEAKNILKQKWRVTESNTHPNTAAQYFQSTFIENWLRTL